MSRPAPRRPLTRAQLACPLGCAVAAALSVGCGAGMPLLHPAQTLAPGQMRAGAGASHLVSFGPAGAAVDEAQALGATSDAIPASEHEAFVRGAMADAIAGQGLAPWVGVRAGLPAQNEMGITWSGRRIRGDLRHAFEWDTLALSVGAGVGGYLPDLDSTASTGGATPERLDDDRLARFDGGGVSGWSVDVPVLIGTRTQPDLVAAYGGARFLVEHLSGDFTFNFDSSAPLTPGRGTGSRWFAGAVVGLSVAIAPIRLGLEVQGGYENLTADLQLPSGEVTSRLDGLSLTPAFAVQGDL